ncbi:hypothetical protein CHELA40_14251 [Chelatococcus asaccharovorans]|nr:hypothetical protein CHELA17_61369 [Chelatococcus asaccharovorans]CAH1676225.1 hypothetical protein CHELA40_14251 [Chelatococcus asaccharovorans]
MSHATVFDFPWVWLRVEPAIDPDGVASLALRSVPVRTIRAMIWSGNSRPTDRPRRRTGTMKRSRYNSEPCFACLIDLYEPPGAA